MQRDIPGLPTFHRHSASQAAFGAVALAVSIGLGLQAARAVDGLVLEIDAATGPGWRLAGLTIGLDLDAAGAQARVSITEFRLTDLEYTARELKVDCGRFELQGSRVACHQARVAGDIPDLGTQDATGSIVYDRTTGDVDLTLAGLVVADGRADLAVSTRAGGQRIQVRATNADAAKLHELLAQLDEPLALAPTAGRIDFEVTTQGRMADIETVDFVIAARGLSAGNEAGTIAAESLDLSGTGTVHREGTGWRFETEVALPAGQAYVEPIFVDLAAGRLEAQLSGGLTVDGAVAIDRFQVDHHERVRARGTARLHNDGAWIVDALEVQLDEIALPGFWSTYAAPFLLDTGFANLETGGRLTGSVAVRDAVPEALELTLDGVTVDDGQGALSVADLSGVLHWQSAESSTDVEEEEEDTATGLSHLTWANGSLFGLDLGAAELRFSARGRGLRLLEETRIPVLDGAVRLEAFRIRNLAQDNVAFLVGAEMEPISVALLCRAFGWPEFGGTLAGTIRKLRMRDGVISLGTTLAAQVFDGEVRLSELRLERPFGDWPRLFANIELEALDLEQVTSAFAFGRITGRLGGNITRLELFNWVPVAFDAQLATPPNDRSKHRISQRAVENIGSLGGSSAGVTTALSSGFLRFFEDFNYDRLGITCRLRNEVCQMGGVAPADGGGYYLVKGKGVPRIDVIGNRRRVDWPRLVRQLIAITESEGPVVE